MKVRSFVKNSLQLRLSLGLALGVGLLWLAATTVSGLVVKHELDGAFDQALAEAVERLLPPVIHDIVEGNGRSDEMEDLKVNGLHIGRIGKSWRTENGITRDGFKQGFKRRLHKDNEEDDDGEEKGRQDVSQKVEKPSIKSDDDQYLTYIVRDAQGGLLLQSNHADPEIFPSIDQLGFITLNDQRIFTGSTLDGNVIISVADPMERRQRAAHDTLKALAMPLFFLVPLSMFGVWLLVRISMRPMRGFRSGIEARGAGDLTPIRAKNLPSEIEPIADAVNNLLDRMRRTLEAERSFTANSAHELRTPVAAALAQTQRLISEAGEGSIGDRAHQIETALKSLSRLTEKLMQLARAEGGSMLSEQERDIVPIARLVMDEFREDSERLDILLPSEPLPLLIDANVFAILLRNLVENALKHATPESIVTITLARDKSLSVTNDCDPIPADVMERLLRPFERGNTSAKGSGVGLAIVEAITKGSGASLSLKSPITGTSRGFEAMVRF
ncbi:sensor histidine kinase [Cohaesibacter haloalkalitolerans]|uniref:sensor histidine kinase n=1 Tax=Cohaesibacter haloalkalitolerans TaxID=1162980 RepID=UPI000E646ACB|nr:HAMP domain-containing sensor histidine kinase [Cohaesibacter haloalkalitolerans]